MELTKGILARALLEAYLLDVLHVDKWLDTIGLRDCFVILSTRSVTSEYACTTQGNFEMIEKAGWAAPTANSALSKESF